VATTPHTDVSRQRTRACVGQVYSIDEVRGPAVSWCEMPGAVNRACGGDEFVIETNISFEKVSGRVR
jgi:hypothetical protein